MPKIRPYQQQTSPDGGIGGRQASGSDFGGPGLFNLGQATVSSGFDLARSEAILEQAKARKEATDADLAITQLHTDLAQEIERRRVAWKPGDPSLSEQMTPIIKARLDEQAGGEETERYETAVGRATYQTRAAHLTSQLVQGLIPLDAALAGHAAQVQFNQTVDASANLVRNNPALVQSKMADMTAVVNNPVGLFSAMSAPERDKILRDAHERIAVNAVYGFIGQRPNLALEVLTDPNLKYSETYGWINASIPSEKLEPLITHARTAISLQEHAAKNAEAAYLKATEDAALSQYSQLTFKYLQHREDPKAPPLTPGDMLQMDLAASRHPERLLSLQGILDQDAREAREGATKGDPYVARALFTAISKGEMEDITPINRARSRGQLTPEQHNELINEWNDARTPEGRSLIKESEEFFKRHETVIMPKDLTGVLADPDSGPRMLKFQHDVRAQMNKDRKEGLNPFLRLDPNAKEYMGTPENIARYVSPFLERIRKAAERLAQQPGLEKTPEGEVKPDLKRLPGESIDEYKKRTGK